MGDEPIWFICSFARHVAFKSAEAAWILPFLGCLMYVEARQPVPKTRETKFCGLDFWQSKL